MGEPGDPRMSHWLTPAELTRKLEAQRDGSALLLWKDGDAVLQIVALRPGSEYLIGRRDNTQIRLDADPKVSALHAKLTCVAGTWRLDDEDWSRNGTYLNEQRTRTAWLRDQDVIRAGRTLLQFCAPAAGGSVTTTIPDDTDGPVPQFDEMDRAILVELCRTYFTDADNRRLLAPVGNHAIAAAVHLTEDGVSQRFRRMYGRCGIAGGKNDKRQKLMRVAILKGIVTLRDYDQEPDGER